MQVKTLCLPLLAFIFTLSFTKLPPVTAHYVPSPNAIFHTQEGDLDPEHFWQRARELGDAARRMRQRASKDVRDKIGELKARMDSIVHAATALHELKKLTVKRRESDDDDDDDSRVSTTDLAGDLERALEKVLEELQVMFPAPNEAPGHEDRQKAVSSALEKAGAELKAVCGKHGMDEENVAAHWETIQGAIENMVVLLGDLVEQHPDLLNILLFTGAVMLIPEYWVLRPVLGLFGFGPTGPGKGTVASWAQRVFYGAAVPEGSWFALLQKAAMAERARSWWGWLGGLVVGAGLFGSCGGRR
ncbi:hypothetical protein B0H14DRAFT_2911950 [Mycena olivaceomarginata]|nr:hypothetical protein B0H14DRAFT_2911950 [Mycena olivaceomarginata]